LKNQQFQGENKMTNVKTPAPAIWTTKFQEWVANGNRFN
jgi:hypothetical protein